MAINSSSESIAELGPNFSHEQAPLSPLTTNTDASDSMSSDRVRSGLLYPIPELYLLGREAIGDIDITPISVSETKVLELVSTGHTYKSAALERYVTGTTIIAQMRNLRRKLGAVHLTHAVRIGIESGIIPIEIDASAPHPVLTRTEKTELNAISIGATPRQAAKQRGIAMPTIRSHYKSIREKLEVNNMAWAVRVAFELGILPLPEED